jgi:hypothetical protein
MRRRNSIAVAVNTIVRQQRTHIDVIARPHVLDQVFRGNRNQLQVFELALLLGSSSLRNVQVGHHWKNDDSFFPNSAAPEYQARAGPPSRPDVAMVGPSRVSAA